MLSSHVPGTVVASSHLSVNVGASAGIGLKGGSIG